MQDWIAARMTAKPDLTLDDLVLEIANEDQMTVHRVGALSNQESASSISHYGRLLGLTIHGDKRHGRMRSCLSDRLRIDHVVFLKLPERFDVGRQN